MTIFMVAHVYVCKAIIFCPGFFLFIYHPPSGVVGPRLRVCNTRTIESFDRETRKFIFGMGVYIFSVQSGQVKLVYENVSTVF